MKCNHCGGEMVWQGSMLDGGMHCPSCVAGDTHGWNKEANFGGIIIDDSLAAPDVGDTYIISNNMPLKDFGSGATTNHVIFRTIQGRSVLLSQEAENDYQEWLDLGGCSCHKGHAPCSSCTHPGHPISLENRDDCEFL